MWHILAGLLLVTQPAADSGAGVPQPPLGRQETRDTTTAAYADAYLDDTARALIRGARARREMVDRSILSYEVVAYERLSIGLNTPGRERLLYGQETITRVAWHRDDDGRLEMLAARSVAPVITTDVSAPRAPAHLAFDPVNDGLVAGLGGRDFLRHPLAPGAEADYRYRSGDSTIVRLPDGFEIRLREVVLLPRRSDPRLIGGSIWIDEASHAVVQALVRPVRPFDLIAGIDESSEDERSRARYRGSGNSTFEGEIQRIWVEYGWWNRRWWLPVVVTFEGVARFGGYLTVPLSIQRRYEGYDVVADPDPPVPVPRELDAAVPAETERECPDDDAGCACWRGRCFEVVRPSDEELIGSELFTGSFFESETRDVISAEELEALADRLAGKTSMPWQVARPGLSWRIGRGGLLRYNRVEGVSIGVRGDVDVGRLLADATVRFAVAPRRVNADLGISRAGGESPIRLAVYDRLAAANPGARPLTLGNSATAFLFGRDDGEYFRARGVELTGRPASSSFGGVHWRLFAERQGEVSKATDFSVRRSLGADIVFRDNLVADRADLVGISATLRAQTGVDPASARWGAELSLTAATGTFDYVQPSATLRATVPLAARWSTALEVAAGTTGGSAPVQAYWYLGGPSSLRGFHGAAIAGESFWRARAELARGAPGARLALFTDVGWAGPRGEFTRPENRPLVGVGTGISLLDGILRLDVTRAVQGGSGWRLDFYFDGAL